MNIRQIETFMAVAQLGSFRQAAEQLHRSPSAISTHVQQLEQEIGLLLLERTTRKVCLTAAGEKLLLHSKSVLAELRSVVQDLREESTLQRGHVSIGCAPSLCAYRLPQILEVYQQSFPKVALQLHESFAKRMYQDLSERVTDFAIGPRLEELSGFDLRPVMKDRMVAVLPKTSRWVNRSKVKLVEIASLPQLCMGPASAMLSAIEAAFREKGLAFSPRFQVLQQQTLFSLVEHGMGMAIVPSTCVPRKPGNYVVLGLIDPTIVRQLYIITIKGRRLSPAAQKCADMIEEGLSG
jgi:DNA-binding transcriptional LysR family regulator